MDKTLLLVISATVMGLVALVLIPTMTSSLGDTGETKDQLQQDTTCEVQTREAERVKDPTMVEDRCLDYIDDTSFKTEAEAAEVSCILSGTC